MVVVAIFGVLGFCIGLLTGSTGATVGVLLGGIFLVFVRSVLRRRLVLGPATVALEPGGEPERDPRRRHDVRRAAPHPERAPTASWSFVERTVSLAHGLGYWAVLLAALIAVTG